MKNKIKVNPQDKSTPASNTDKLNTSNKISLKSKLNWRVTLETIVGKTDFSVSAIKRAMTSQSFPQDWEIIDKSRCGLIDLIIKIRISADRATLSVEEHSDTSYWSSWKKEVNYFITRMRQLSNSNDKDLTLIEVDPLSSLVTYKLSVFFNSIDELKQKTILLKKYINDMSIAFGEGKGRKYKSPKKPQS